MQSASFDAVCVLGRGSCAGLLSGHRLMVFFSIAGRQLQSTFGGRMQQGMRGSIPPFGEWLSQKFQFTFAYSALWSKMAAEWQCSASSCTICVQKNPKICQIFAPFLIRLVPHFYGLPLDLYRKHIAVLFG